jgi:hypothetical protein
VKLTNLQTVLCVATLLAIAAAAPAQSGEMISVTLDSPGHVEEIPFELEKPSVVSVSAFFPAAELGAVSFAVTDADGNPVKFAAPKVLKPGSYSAAVSAAGVSDDSFSVKIDVSEPNDVYEPNDTIETATSITLPLRTVIGIDRGADNLDWFKFSVDQPYLLSVHLRTRGGSSVSFRVLDAEGKILYKTASTWDSAGARYASLTPGEYHLVVGPGAAGETAEMELALYDPDAAVSDTGGFIAIGMDEASDALNQLSLIAKTSGKGLVETLSPEIIKAELLEAVKDKPVEAEPQGGAYEWLLWLGVVLILAGSGTAGFWMRAKFRARDKAAEIETPDKPAEAEIPDPLPEPSPESSSEASPDPS